MSFRKRLIGKPPEVRPDVLDVASKRAWQYLEEVKADPDRLIPEESIFRPRGYNATVHVIKDFVVGFPYTVLRGSEPTVLDELSKDIQSIVPTYQEHEILGAFRSATNMEEHIRAIHYVGVAAPQQFDERYQDVFRMALSVPAVPVRLAALDMIAYAGWPELKGLLEQVRTSDPDLGVREEADKVLKAISSLSASNQ